MWRFILICIAVLAFGIAAFGHLINLAWDFPLVPLGLFCWLLSTVSDPRRTT
jgi:hypothetical protein